MNTLFTALRTANMPVGMGTHQRGVVNTALRMVVIMTFLTGFLYTLLLTLCTNAVFYQQATGSIVRVHGKAIGSALLGQRFADARYFRTRPSAGNYETVASAASNYGPTSAALREQVAHRRDTLSGLYNVELIPNDLLFTSGSGLDPHISPAAARVQIHSVARARALTPQQEMALRKLVEQHIEPPQLGILGNSRVNVLQLNIALDAMQW